MITRFDHAVIAVRTLDEAVRQYRALGFAATLGGQHPGQGTANAVVRFGLDYLELLAVTDEGEAKRAGLNGRSVLDFLQSHSGGLVGYALASEDLAQDAARLRSRGLAVEGPFAMRRERPDGSVLEWQLAIPGDTPWRRPWPFLISWETPDAERLAGEPPEEQPNGVRGVAGVTVFVWDLDAGIALYQQGLGLVLQERTSHDDWEAEGAQFMAGGTRIDLLAPRDVNGDGHVARALRAEGEGLFSVLLLGPEEAAGARLMVRPAEA